MPKNVNLNHFSMWRSGKKIVGLSPNSNADLQSGKSRASTAFGFAVWFALEMAMRMFEASAKKKMCGKNRSAFLFAVIHMPKTAQNDWKSQDIDP